MHSVAHINLPLARVSSSRAADRHGQQHPRPMQHLCAGADPQNTTLQGTGEASDTAPWTISPYYTKQKERRLGELGEILESPETTEEPLGWTPDAKLQLSIQVVSRELGKPEQEVAQQVQLLNNLLPDLRDHIGTLKTADLVRLSTNLEETAEKLLLLREALPMANISRIVAGNWGLLRMSKGNLLHNLQQVVAMLNPHAPQQRWQELLEEVPMLSDAEQLKATLAEVARLFGSPLDSGIPVSLLISSPELALSCQDLKPQGGNNTDD